MLIGKVEYSKDIIEQIELQLSYFDIEEILQNISNSFSHAAEFELLVAKKKASSNMLFYVTPSSFERIDEAKSIGSGNKITQLTDTLLNFTKGFDFKEDDPKTVLSKMVAFLQIIIYKNGFLEYGVGGTVCGACLEEEIIWNDDLFYLFYERNFEDRVTLNVSVREDVLLTGSDFNETNKIFGSLTTNKDSFKRHNIIRKLLKILNTTPPRFIVFYSKFYNCIYFNDTNRRNITSIGFRYLKRGSQIKVAFINNPDLVLQLCSHQSDEKINIPVFYIKSFQLPYISREDLLNMYNIEDVMDMNETYDFDLDEIDINIPNNLIRSINIDKFAEIDDVLIIDFQYLFTKIKERLDHYKGLNIKLNASNISKAFTKFMGRYTAENSLKQYIIYYSNGEDYIIDGENILTNFISSIENVISFEFSNDNYYLGVVANTSIFLKEYYVNEKYFGIDKICKVLDNTPINQILELLPTSNYNPEETDLILIRNHKYETNIKVPIVYYVVDYLIDDMFNITQDNALLWDSYKGTEEEELIKYMINDTLGGLSISLCKL
ncbi:hypothetical protein JJQ72_16665 [Paenibacillus sp. F411]|uniref:hypothetical protein n=1 Tax=Paenibacillus sp. F411 TaxID=2820239 RepID=UPI001AAEB642|nr:hypothetical protein [Paenibacillus sp. F411]MBO2945613.1 hypothetical protein [Paenibacillus sp. F411]